MDEPRELLSAHLWDLRAQLESELRCLTNVQQLLASMRTPAGTSQHETRKRKIIEDLTNVRETNQTVRAVTADAIAAAERITP